MSITCTEPRPAGDRARGLLGALRASALAAALGACAALPAPPPPAATPAPAADAPAAASADAPSAESDAASAAAAIPDSGTPDSPYRPLGSIPVGTIVHVPTGREMTREEMLDVLADARVVYVGEMHNNMADHEAQLAILEGLEKRHPGRLMVGMEMFARPAQADLDRWLAGDMDAAAFLKLYYRNWSEYYGYYAPILTFIREHHIPLVALNASKEEVRGVSRGTAELPSGYDTADPYSRAYLDAVMGGHGHGGLERFYQVQVLWEETMAESAYRALTSAAGRDRQLVVLAGGGHIQYGFGIPRRLFRRLPTSYATVLPTVEEVPADRPDLQMDVDVPRMPLPIGDFVWLDAFQDLEDRRVKLGVRIEPAAAGMAVIEVEPGSAAADAGVRAGDVLISLDGRPLADMVGVQVALGLAPVGGHGDLVVERDGRRLTLTVAYRTPAPAAPVPPEPESPAP